MSENEKKELRDRERPLKWSDSTRFKIQKSNKGKIELKMILDTRQNGSNLPTGFGRQKHD